MPHQPNTIAGHEPDRMLKHFTFDHLPAKLQPVSEQFAILAGYIDTTLVPGPERTVALRKLLESKDCAVRAKLFPSG